MALLVAMTALIAAPAAPASAQEDPVRILILNKNPGHGSHAQADDAIADLAADIAADEGVVVEVDETNSTAQFDDLAYLEQYDAVVFSYTAGIVFSNDEERTGFQAYIQGGGGYVGLHYAAWSAGFDSEHDVWPWYHDLVGAVSVAHPENPAVIDGDVVASDPSHPLVEGLPERHTRQDEWYDWVVNPANDVRVLLEVDESSYGENKIGRNGTKHPVTWCQDYDGGRSWFTAMGHEGGHWSEDYMRDQLRHGLEYTTGLVEADCSPRAKDDVGSWSDVTPWPLVPINASLTADGKVQTFGSVIPDSCNDTTPFDWSGNSCLHQGGQFEIDVWDPAQERTLDNYLGDVVPNTTYTDLFCSIQINDPNRRVTLTMGGDDSLGGNAPNEAAIGVTSYSDRTGLNDEAPMKYPRWYPTSTVMPNGDIVVQGGSLYGGPGGPGALTPELYTPDEGSGWKSLDAARSEIAYSSDQNRWWYPRAFVSPEGDLFNMTGTVAYSLDPYANEGQGELTMQGDLPADVRDQGELGNPVGATSTAVMYEPGKILQVGGGWWQNGGGPDGARAGFTVDLTGEGGSAAPEYAATEPMEHGRHWHNSTVLPDGKVIVTGGGINNAADGDLANTPEIWDPATGTWESDLATAQHGRLYHSTALLLPDGRVMVGGGGTPGPRNYQDVEFYSPAYLFDGNELAERPQITDAPSELGYGGAFDVAVSEPVDRVTLVRSGSVTHSFNNDQRFQELDFTTTGEGQITVNAPADAHDAPPGTYLLFVWNADGTPSEAELVQIDPEVENDHRTPLVVEQFEYPRVPVGGDYPNNRTLEPGNAWMSPWTVASTVELTRGLQPGLGGLGKTGTHLALGADGEVQRTLTDLRPGSEYRVALRYGRDGRVSVPGGGVVSADISVGDLDDTIVAGPETASNGNQITSGTYVATFTASARSETLTLAASGTNAGVLVDDLVVFAEEPGLADGAVHYAFEEGAGTTAANSGSDPAVGDAILNGNAGWTDEDSGVFGSALDLPGGSPDDGNVVDLPDDLLRDAEDFTVSFWVAPDQRSDWMGLFHIGTGFGGAGGFFQIQTQTQAAGGTGLAATFKAPGQDLQERVYAEPTQDITDGRWNHVAFTREGSTGTLYLDGQPIASRSDLTIDMADIGATENNWLGRNGFPDGTYDGKMDEVRLYSQALTSDDVDALYDAGSSLRTTTTLEVSPEAPAPYGEPVTVTATVAASDGSDAQGTAVLFIDDQMQSGAVTVTDGQASFGPLELGPGEKTFTVRFTAAEGFRDSEATVDYEVERPPPGEGVPIHYAFEEGEGSTTANAGTDVTFGPATLEGGAAWTSDAPRGTGVDLPGVDGDYVDLPDDLLVNAEDAFSVSLWANPEALPNWVPLVQIGNGTATYFTLQSNLQSSPGGAGFGATFKSPAGVEERLVLGAGNDLPLNEWTHVVFTMQGSTGRIYFDGELQGERTDYSVTVDDVGVDGATVDNYLGNNSWPDAPFPGKFDDLRIYNHELSAEDVVTLFEGEPPVETTVTATADEVLAGEDATVDVTVSPSEATGTVEVADGDTTRGSAELADGAATVTVDADDLEVGTNTLTVRYLGAEGFAPSSTEVTIEVVAGNQEPTVDDLSLETEQDTAVDGQVVASDPDADALSYAFGGAGDGTVSGNTEDGSFTYTPDDGFVGTDTFAVTVDDGNGGTATATVTITVTEVVAGNQEPTVDDLSLETEQDTAVDGQVVASDPDEDALSYAFGAALNGTVAGNTEDGSFTYTPDDGFVGTDTFAVTVDDGNGATATARVTITVTEDVDTGPDTDPDDEFLSCDPGADVTFSDVSPTSVHADAIGCGDALRLLEGKGGGVFAPGGSLTRGQAATIIDRIATATGRPIQGPRVTFDDVGPGYTHAGAIERLAGAGVIEGFSDGTFRPQAPVRRDQLAALLVRYIERVSGEELPVGEPFVDVPSSSVHAEALAKARAAGIVEGDAAGRAHPGLRIRRDQAASLFVRSLQVLPVAN